MEQTLTYILLFICGIVGVFFLLVPRFVTFVFTELVAGVITTIGAYTSVDNIFVLGVAGHIAFFIMGVVLLFTHSD